MKKAPLSASPVLSLLAFALVALLIISTLVGKYPIALGDILSVLLSGTGKGRNDRQVATVLFEIRQPRIAAAALVGAAARSIPVS